MEYNKDEALKCIDLAKKCVSVGNYQKAYKFTDKSIRLFPTPIAKGLKEQILQVMHTTSRVNYKLF